MVSRISRILTLPSAEATTRFAAALAPALEPGDVLLLDGPIGAGKTHFARALIQARLAAAGLVEEVPSPTYTLVQTYCDGRTELWHADLYRLGGADEVAELGLESAFFTAICLVEWPDRLAEMIPAEALELRFRPVGDSGTRQLTLHASGGRWSRRLAGVLALLEAAGA